MRPFVPVARAGEPRAGSSPQPCKQLAVAFAGVAPARALAESIVPHVPIVALTADAMQGTRERCLNSGMNEYLTKPVVLNQLKKIIDLFV